MAVRQRARSILNQGIRAYSFFRQDLLDADPVVARAMVLDGHTDYGLVSVRVEHFLAEREEWRKVDVPHIQAVDIYHDPTDGLCGPAHYYLVEPAETEKLQRYVKDVLVKVAVVEQHAKNLTGGKRV